MNMFGLDSVSGKYVKLVYNGIPRSRKYLTL
jgi:hypothetical protein